MNTKDMEFDKKWISSHSLDLNWKKGMQSSEQDRQKFMVTASDLAITQ